MFKTKLLLAGLLCLIALPLSAQVNDTYAIPAAIRSEGAANTYWLTELYLFNPQRHQLVVAAVLLPTGVEPAVERLITLPANTTFFTEDVMGQVFNRSGSGALLLATFPEDNPGVPDEILARSFVASSKTFNTASTGTFGQSIPGTFAWIMDVEADPYSITAVGPGIQNWGTRGVNGFRTNIGAMNLGRGSVTMRVYVYDSQGREVKNIPFSVPPMGHMQDSLPEFLEMGTIEFVIENDFYANDPNDYAVVFPYASVVDNKSGDAIYVNPTLLASTDVVYPTAGAKTPQATAAQANGVRKLTLDVARRAKDVAKFEGHVKLEMQNGRYTVAK